MLLWRRSGADFVVKSCDVSMGEVTPQDMPIWVIVLIPIAFFIIFPLFWFFVMWINR